jgi:hypothetical protein
MQTPWVKKIGWIKTIGTGSSLILCALLAILCRAEEVTPNSLANHQGIWNVVSFNRNETMTPKEITDSIIRIVEKDHVVWKRNGKAFAGTKIVLDDSKNPKWIDVLPDGGPGKGDKIPGIYKQESDTLTICMADIGKPRPLEFTSPKGSDHTLMVFRRTKPMSTKGTTQPFPKPDEDKK